MNKLRPHLNRIMQFWPQLLILLLLVFARYVLQWNIPRALLLLPVAVIACVGTRDQIVAACFCCIPLYTSFQYVFALSILILAYLFRFPKQFRLNVYVLPVLLMVLWESLHMIGAEDVSLKLFVGNFVPIGFCAFILCCDTKQIDYPYIIRVLAASVLCVCGFLLLKVLFSDGVAGFEAFMKLQYRLGEESRDVELVGLYFNPNTLAYICLHAGIGLIQLILSQRYRKLDFLLLAMLLFFGLVTLSRTYLVCVALVVVLLVLDYPCEWKLKKKIVAYLCVAALICAALMFAVFPTLMLSFMKRIFTKGPGVGRGELFVQYMVHSFSSLENFFYGTGLHGMHDKLMALYETNVPHNGIQEILVAWGLPGLVLFAGHLGAMWMRGRRDVAKPKLLHYLPLLILLVKVQFGQIISSHITLLMLAMCSLSIGYDFYGSKETQEIEPKQP